MTNKEEKQNKRIIILLVGVLLVLFLNLGYNIWHLHNYQEQRASGNEKWKQVEERIHLIEKKVDGAL